MFKLVSLLLLFVFVYRQHTDGITQGKILESYKVLFQVCPLITDEVNNDLNSILDTLELQSDIDENCYIDYSLIQPPFVTKEALFVNGKGKFCYLHIDKQYLLI